MIASPSTLFENVDQAIHSVTNRILQTQRPDGSWADRLSSSALSTASSAMARYLWGRQAYAAEIDQAIQWLRTHQRDDGGWSDAESYHPSSLNGTAPALAALQLIDPDGSGDAIARGLTFVTLHGGQSALRDLSRTTIGGTGLILMTLAGFYPWNMQPDQPMEIVLLPRRWRNKVSIGLPGLIAWGLMQDQTLPRSRWRTMLRRWAVPRALAWLRSVQAPNGGVLECPFAVAIMLMALHVAKIGEDIQEQCVHYLVNTRRDDGSWAIDRDLEVSVTCYLLNALTEHAVSPNDPLVLKATTWLAQSQRQEFSPLGMPPGGWSWANPSGWPEADDTATVLLTLLPHRERTPIRPAIDVAAQWLLHMQNTNGSWSEWVRNSTILMDQPCPAVTAQACMALYRYSPNHTVEPIHRAVRYLQRTQRPDGSFHALWFRNYVFGTAKVVEMCAALDLTYLPMAEKAISWLLSHQNENGSWGGPSGELLGTPEETAWALYALLKTGIDVHHPAILRSIHWLVTHLQDHGGWNETPVGLYFMGLRYASDQIANAYGLRALSLWFHRSKE
ncbi:MAG: hypothetical protein C7B47_15495 [Sulfobacillus thermosulfidooxidans]|uniref:Squalene--hopene cyclase n=1 Tax=Sulfobacillus thermosulfidooxidans TaxID=28034 RepID=A0A2T2WP40_SULTH|nr:MAG: hypothetical protein C7B47_15495 [Sulfobacillus thermosulfidooxidans]